MKNTKKLITEVINDEWSMTLKMFLRLNDDSYNYNDVTDNS
jgi:hypothetical protein